MKINNGYILCICLHIDDLISTSNNPALFEDFKRTMVYEFEMTDTGLVSYFLGIKVKASP